MVAALTFDPSVADDLSPLFESALIPQIATPSSLTPETGRQKRRTSRSSMEVRQEHPEVKVIADVLQRYGLNQESSKRLNNNLQKHKQNNMPSYTYMHTLISYTYIHLLTYYLFYDGNHRVILGSFVKLEARSPIAP